MPLLDDRCTSIQLIEWFYHRGILLSSFWWYSTFTEPIISHAHDSCTAFLLLHEQINPYVLMLPVLHVIQNDSSSLLRGVLSAQGLDKVALRIHEVKVDAVINQVVLSWLNILRCAKVDTVLLAESLDLVVCARKANELVVELAEVLLKRGRVVTGGVAGNENGEESIGGLLLDDIEHGGHLVELFGADIGASGEAEVDLYKLAIIPTVELASQ